MRRLALSLALAAAVATLVGSVAFTASHHRGTYRGTGVMMAGPGADMMGGGGALWLVGDGNGVGSIAAARARAALAADAAGLHPGEVIWFDNGFYVELKDAEGSPATEVIVDPRTGTVSTEPGPAMMWNTRFGMHRAGDGAAVRVSAEQAQQIAGDWLARSLPGRRAAEPDTYPGYYTMETTTDTGTINGMLSVNSTTGEVWYHSWHGRFIAREDA
jgi:hypothetical protein